LNLRSSYRLRRNEPPPPDPRSLGLKPWFFLKPRKLRGGPGNEFLQPGDRVEIEIERLGRLDTWIV
jgi:hypothetical protein